MNFHITYFLSSAILYSSHLYAEPNLDSLLAGPEIVEEEVNSEDLLQRRLNETGKVAQVIKRDQARLWMSVYSSIDLNSAQREEFNLIVAELQDAQKEFQSTYGKEIKELRKTQKNTDQVDMATIRNSRERMMKIQAHAPNVTDYQKRAWALLSLEQHKAFQISYQLLIEEEAKKKTGDRKDKGRQSGEMQLDESALNSEVRKDAADVQNPKSVLRDKKNANSNSLKGIRFLRKLQKLQSGEK